MKYFISAGEASGDLHASRLILALKKRDAEARFSFLGGPKMKTVSGIEPLIDINEMAVMGFGQVVRRLPKILRQIDKAKEFISTWKPDALILIDYPSFNLKLARHAHNFGIKVFWYISPKVWVWKEHRVKAMKKYIDRLYSILPFEVEYFKRRHQWDVMYVGNPSAEEVREKKNDLSSLTHEQFLRENSLPPGKPILALLPGSRVAEIRSNLPVMIKAASDFPQFQPVIAGVTGLSAEIYDNLKGNLPIVTDKTFELLNFSEAALVTSGTATLETALLKVPQVMMFRHSASKLMYQLFRRFLKVDYFSLPNLINDNETISELVMHYCTPDAVTERLLDVIPGGAGHERQQKDYDSLILKLGTGSPSEAVADDIIKNIS